MVKPTTRGYVHRLELMLNHIKYGNCRTYCPGHRGFDFQNEGGAIPNAGLSVGDWCRTCRDFMVIPSGHCPCHWYGPDEAIAEAVNRIAEYRRKNQ